MAIVNSYGPSPLDEIKTYDYPIGGKLIVASTTFPDHPTILSEDAFREEVRKALAYQIVEKMIEGRLIEFTQVRDPVTMNILVRARAYAAPDSDVKILRSFHKL